MKLSIKRALMLGAAILGIGNTALADKGMWILSELTKANLQQMKDLGFQLSADSLYSLNKPSVANSVVIFGRGCTGVTVSKQGLIMTNHHCGYDAIQSTSTVEHDYLRDGFVSQTFQEEIPIEGLTVKYLHDTKDVTAQILAKVRKPKNEVDRITQITKAAQELVEAERKRLKDDFKEVSITSFYAGNKYYMITYNVFRDVRMVFAPPSSIGKFGGETDNWMWPRHTGDFAVFRVYAGADNKPAAYSKTNVPYQPKYSAEVSLQGYKEGEYAMTIGFPGSTDRYIPSWGIENRMQNQNDVLIEVRGAKQAIWKKAMEADQATRIKYASKYAQSSNYWKNSIGMNRGLTKLAVLDRKRAEEASFSEWTATKEGKAYADVLPRLQKAYAESGTATRKFYYLNETLRRGSEIYGLASALNAVVRSTNRAVAVEELEKLYKDYLPSLDAEVLPVMLDLLRKELSAEEGRPIFSVIDEQYKGDSKAFAKDLFARSLVPYAQKVQPLMGSNAELQKALEADPALAFYRAINEVVTTLQSQLTASRPELSWGNRLYFAGRALQNPERPMPSDANFTMRMSYGSIVGYSPSDAVQYSYYTTPRGLLEKYNPNESEFALKTDYLDMIKSGKWGQWADKDTKSLHVAFLSTNDITGGNSGSPVFDKNGRVIGLAFDGNWEAMSGDIEFEPELQRTISVDIRYVLYVINEWGKCPRLVDELVLRK